MAIETPNRAVKNYLSTLQSVLSCITPARFVVSAGGYKPSASPHSLVLNRFEPVKLSGVCGISLKIGQFYKLFEEKDFQKSGWRVRVLAYQYSLSDDESREIIAYHWHPGSISRERAPHLHLGAGALIGRAELAKTHLPTNNIAIEEMIRFAISAFGVIPRRDDWDLILTKARQSDDEFDAPA